jgi:hypothetical protein
MERQSTPLIDEVDTPPLGEVSTIPRESTRLEELENQPDVIIVPEIGAECEVGTISRGTAEVVCEDNSAQTRQIDMEETLPAISTVSQRVAEVECKNKLAQTQQVDLDETLPASSTIIQEGAEVECKKLAQTRHIDEVDLSIRESDVLSANLPKVNPDLKPIVLKKVSIDHKPMPTIDEASIEETSIAPNSPSETLDLAALGSQLLLDDTVPDTSIHAEARTCKLARMAYIGPSGPVTLTSTPTKTVIDTAAMRRSTRH